MATTELEVVKISELTEATSVDSTDVFPVSKSSATYKMSYDTLKDAVEDDIEDIIDSAVSAATASATASATAAAASATAAAESAEEANDWASNLTFDSTPTSGSSNPVTSDGIYEAVTDLKSAFEELGLSVVDGKINITYTED